MLTKRLVSVIVIAIMALLLWHYDVDMVLSAPIILVLAAMDGQITGGSSIIPTGARSSPSSDTSSTSSDTSSTSSDTSSPGIPPPQRPRPSVISSSRVPNQLPSVPQLLTGTVLEDITDLEMIQRANILGNEDAYNTALGRNPSIDQRNGLYNLFWGYSPVRGQDNDRVEVGEGNHYGYTSQQINDLLRAAIAHDPGNIRNHQYIINDLVTRRNPYQEWWGRQNLGTPLENRIVINHNAPEGA